MCKRRKVTTALQRAGYWAAVGRSCCLVCVLALCAAMTAGCAADGSPAALLTADQARYVPTASAARSSGCLCCALATAGSKRRLKSTATYQSPSA